MSCHHQRGAASVHGAACSSASRACNAAYGGLCSQRGGLRQVQLHEAEGRWHLLAVNGKATGSSSRRTTSPASGALPSCANRGCSIGSTASAGSSASADAALSSRSARSLAGLRLPVRLRQRAAVQVHLPQQGAQVLHLHGRSCDAACSARASQQLGERVSHIVPWGQAGGVLLLEGLHVRHGRLHRQRSEGGLHGRVQQD